MILIEFEQKLVKNLFDLQRPSVRRVHDSRRVGFYVTANLSRNEIEGHEKVHFKRPSPGNIRVRLPINN